MIRLLPVAVSTVIVCATIIFEKRRESATGATIKQSLWNGPPLLPAS